jgi:hypothetical protein
MKKQTFAFTYKSYVYTFACDGTNALIKATHTSDLHEWLLECPVDAFKQNQLKRISLVKSEIQILPEVIFSIFEPFHVEANHHRQIYLSESESMYHIINPRKPIFSNWY